MTIDRHALDRLREIVGGEESDLFELVESFLAEGPMLVERLAASQQTGDLAGARLAAHSLKSNARDMGAAELGELCAKLEATCAAGELPSAAELEAAQRAFAAAVAELGAMFSRGAST